MMTGLRKSLIVLALMTGAFAPVSSGSAVSIQQPVKWPKGTIKIAVSASIGSFGTGIKPGSDFKTALIQSLQRWEEAADVEFEIAYSDSTSISPPGASGDGISLITIAGDTENFLAFSKESSNASAITRLFFDGRGNITEADIVLNPGLQFSGDQTPGTFDLETVLTHEIGHFLGLRHTNVPSSAMFEGIQRNSVFGVHARPKTLSFDDRSKIRAIYGPNPLATKCCSSIAGKAFPNSKIWLQDQESGALIQSLRTGKDGTFEFAGIDAGRYQVLVQQVSVSGEMLPVTVFGNVAANTGENRVSGKVEPKKPITFGIESIGLTDQVSNRAVRVSPGEVYRLTLVGSGLRQEGLSFGTTSPQVILIPLRLEVRDHSARIPAMGFELVVDPNAKPGQYSIYAEDAENQRNYFLGGVWVE